MNKQELIKNIINSYDTRLENIVEATSRIVEELISIRANVDMLSFLKIIEDCEED